MKGFKFLLCITLAFSMLLFSACNKDVAEKSFEKEHFSIVLDSSFKERDASGAYAYYVNSDYLVVCVRETFDSLPEGYADFTVEKYAEAVCVSNEKSEDCIKNAGGYCYLEYTSKVEKKDFYYNSFIIKGSNAFYIVSFAAEQSEENSADSAYFFERIATVGVS